MASQTSSDRTLQAPNAHPTAHLPGDEPQSDNDDTSTIYFAANSRTPTPSHESTITNLKHEFVKVHKERIEIMNRLSSLEPLPSPESLEERLESLEVSFIIVTIINYISGSNYIPARREARTALKKAQGIGDEVLIARCYYWMGRIEFELNNFAAAYVYFRAAQPCVMDEEYPEGRSVEFYLSVSRPSNSEEYRSRAVLEHNRTILEAADEQDPSDPRVVVKPKKRKRDTKTWELVLRPAPDRSLRGRPGQKDGKAKGMQDRGKATVWMVHDTSDLPQYSKVAVESRNNVFDTQDMEWLVAQQSLPPLEWRRFTFRCYIRDISPRTRPTDIFLPQPCEVIFTAEEWNYLRNGVKGRPISISYLAEERKMLEELKRCREAENLEEQEGVFEVRDN